MIDTVFAACSALTGSAQTCRLRTAQPADRPAPRPPTGFEGNPQRSVSEAEGRQDNRAQRGRQPHPQPPEPQRAAQRDPHTTPQPPARQRPRSRRVLAGRLPPSTAPQGAPFRLRCRPSASLRVAHQPGRPARRSVEGSDRSAGGRGKSVPHLSTPNGPRPRRTVNQAGTSPTGPLTTPCRAVTAGSYTGGHDDRDR